MHFTYESRIKSIALEKQKSYHFKNPFHTNKNCIKDVIFMDFVM